ncbi:MAG: nuclear transport factor 2 family protein [Gemmatimonadaceae bacterium]|nr:nuclear transport factor 2 family protein [Gemmatimonadaceae bacterium]
MKTTRNTVFAASAFAVTLAASFAVNACAPKEQSTVNDSALKEFATRYTAAWCSEQAASVAAHFAEHGSLKINAGSPAVGREAITASAQAFMTAFPDMIVAMDSLTTTGAHPVYHWTLTGTNTGPGGTGKAVRIHGYEEWTMGADGLIAASLGHYDEAEYARQLKEGVSAR